MKTTSISIGCVSSRRLPPRRKAPPRYRAPTGTSSRTGGSRLTRVHYGPLEKIAAAHAHTARRARTSISAMADAVGSNTLAAITRSPRGPTTKAGAFRVYRGLEEIHEVENTSEMPSEFLRVELKTEPLSQDTFRGKFERGLVRGR